MSDYQSLVENIRGFLASSYQEKSNELTAWAERYDRLCREANERLRQCADYLKQRLRVEAIHCAEAAPNLLDLVAALDFPELPDWGELCFRFELPAAPPLSLDTAALLNEAYAQEQPLDGLMAHHRLLALARAPLRNRISVMRRIDEIGSHASVFADDIRTYERQRLEEIRTAVPALARRNDLEGVRVLRVELGEKWTMEVPRDLRQLVDALAAKFQRSTAKAELRRLMPALSDAYSAMSQEEARTVLDQITAIAAAALLSVPADVQEQIDPIAAWLNEQQAQHQQQTAFAAACDTLQQAMDTEVSTPRLERAYRQALLFQLDLPAPLERRYQNTLEQRAAAIRHKRLLVICAVAGGFLLLSGIAGAIVLRVVRSNEVRDSVAMIQQATSEIDGGNIDRPRQLVKQLLEQHGRIANDPAMIKAMSDFKAAAGSEQQRQEQFRGYLASALANGVDKPDMKAVEAAAAVAKTTAEQQAVADVKIRIADYNREQQSKIEQQFASDAKTLSQEMDEQLSAGAMKSSPGECIKKIEQFTTRANELSQRNGVSAGLRQAQSQSLLAILKQRQAGLEENATLAALLNRVEQANSTQEQAIALKAVLTKTDDAKYAGEFRRALDLIPLEQAVEAWTKLTTGWNGKLVPTTRDEASSRAYDLQKYLEANLDSLLARDIEDYLSYLKLGLEVTSPTGPWRKLYHDLMFNPLVHDLTVLTTSEGKRYFVLGDPKITSNSANGEVVHYKFAAITSSDVSRTAQIELPKAVMLKTLKPQTSPQATYAQATIPKLDALDYVGWESMGGRCLRDLLTARDVDPILKGILALNILRLNQRVCDWAGDTAFKKVADALANQNVDDIEWVNPDNPPRAEVLASVNRLLSQLPAPDQIDKAVVSRRDKALAALPLGLTVGGVLVKEEGQARLAMHDSAASAQVAYGVSGSKRLIVVARREAKGWKVDAVAAVDVPGGSLIFVAPAAK